MSDFETHDLGTSTELRILREMAVLVDLMLNSSEQFSLQNLDTKMDELYDHYSKLKDYLPRD